MRRAVAGNAFQLTVETVGLDEETLVDADSGVTATVTLATDGSTHATVVQPTNNGTAGTYNVTVPAIANVDLASVAISYAVSGTTLGYSFDVRVVGERMFTLPDLRRMNDVSRTDLYSNLLVRAARDAAEEFVEDFTEAWWVQRYFSIRKTIKTGNDVLYVPHQTTALTEVMQNTTDITASVTLLRPSGRLAIADDVTLNCDDALTIKGVGGEAHPPSDLARATKLLARHFIIHDDSSIPDRAKTMQTDWAVFMLDTASPNKPTGMPEIDSVLGRYRDLNQVMFA